ncbi:ABC transporter ATP-binding protein [Leucobacter albus]|uniref:ABC transporter ATP-binding protein n=1 Tax=Leucobacter albus TaxID=272210 RepID=A0ABW3TPA1_9MICO
MIPAPAQLRQLRLTEFGAIQGSTALSDPLTLTLEPGTVLGIVGPNGVGKSSLLGAIAHSGIASYGSALFGEEELSATRARRRAQLVSLMAQDHGAPGELRVSELVGVGAWASGRADPGDAVASALARAGIAELQDRRYSELSGGQRQLVQLARVLAQNTPVVLLDEPTSALDLSHQRAVEQIMRGLGNQGRIVIAAIHDLSLALNACTRVLLLDPGGSSHNGAPHEVLGPDRVFAAYGVRTTIHTTPKGRRILAADD